MKRPDRVTRKRCFELRCKSKNGQHLRPEEMKFLAHVLRDYPEWYRSLNKDVFEATKPFGSK